ncbi:CK1 family protein kinase [Trichomonas vaginalis G3]|uniref:non-specific serine/threonine protein kinase n=1 Tax=Trichomonas vaginalis (strain ATCC PRA-98 / G3) TaxID=412133 RepID=A2EWD4_TRIV3|nr:protein kinase protein [Trichomonas vaginalis G3]EAY03038.1 CK1 family protein kinase [Trichomonas vaginalis G3]KAI5531461.1 protein kinase protein [Trichomonas vaginalis G3]|eukprot:XP_001315261.1 CK1 family protein kinase [Trichomonas vaginalis G3]
MLKIETESDNKKSTLLNEHRVYEVIQKKQPEEYRKRFLIEYAYDKRSNVHISALELLGANLDDLKRVTNGYLVDINNTLRIAVETLRCIKDLHAMGIVHGDIKPGNFLVRPNRRFPIALIDFGLSEIEDEDNGSSKYKGTPKYSSLPVLSGTRPKKCDDIYSWIISMVYLLCGSLPWSHINNKDKIKEMMEDEDGEKFKKFVPQELMEIYQYASSLANDDRNAEIDYEKIEDLLARSIVRHYVQWKDPYFWEDIKEEVMLRVSPILLTINSGDKPIPHPDPDSDLYDNEVSIELVFDDSKKRGCCYLI